MYKYAKIISLIMVLFCLIFILCSCSGTDNYDYFIEDAGSLFHIIHDDNLPSQKRINAMFDLTDVINNILSTRESTFLSDEEIEDLFNNQIYVISKYLNEEKNTFIRIVSYVGPIDLCGNQERIWTFIQWWDNTNINSQTIIKGGPELTTDLIIQEINGNPVITMIGHSAIYLPPPVFSLSLILNNNRWEIADILPTQVSDLKAYWHYEQFDELLLIDHAIIGSVQVKASERGDSFYVYSEMNPRDKLYFIFSDEDFTYKLFESPHLIISTSGRSIDHTNMLFDIKIEMSNIIIDDLSNLNLSEVVDLDPYETFESLDDSNYMIAKAGYLTKISECRALLETIQKSSELLQGAQMINELGYQYLQVEALLKHFNLLQANFTEQTSIIQLMLEELPNFYSNQDIDEELSYQIMQFSSEGFSEEEIIILLETGMTNEKIKALEYSIKQSIEEFNLDGYYINEFAAGLHEQVIIIDEMLKLTDQALSELNKLISQISDSLELEHSYIIGGGGGGVYIAQNSTATLLGNAINNNEAEFGGGILAFKGSTVSIEDNIINSNAARFGGGILVGFNSSAALAGNTINGNVAKMGAGLLVLNESSSTIFDNQLVRNKAEYQGGAIWVSSDSIIDFTDPDDNIYNNNFPGNIYREGALMDEGISMQGLQMKLDELTQVGDFKNVVELIDTPEILVDYMSRNFKHYVHVYGKPLGYYNPYLPEDFFHVGVGNCEDFAAFASYVLDQHGYDVFPLYYMGLFDTVDPLYGTLYGHTVAVIRDDNRKLRYITETGMGRFSIFGDFDTIEEILKKEEIRTRGKIFMHGFTYLGSIGKQHYPKNFADAVEQLNSPPKILNYMARNFQFKIDHQQSDLSPQALFQTRQGNRFDFARFINYLLQHHGYETTLLNNDVVVYHDNQGKVRSINHHGEHIMRISQPYSSIDELRKHLETIDSIRRKHFRR